MGINRALFNMIDPKTNQLIEDRYRREKILRQHFERGFLVDEEHTPSSLKFSEAELIRMEAPNDSSFEWNDFNTKPRLVLFDLRELSQSFDSLFLYTNINAPNSVLTCKV